MKWQCVCLKMFATLLYEIFFNLPVGIAINVVVAYNGGLSACILAEVSRKRRFLTLYLSGDTRFGKNISDCAAGRHV